MRLLRLMTILLAFHVFRFCVAILRDDSECVGGHIEELPQGCETIRGRPLIIERYNNEQLEKIAAKLALIRRVEQGLWVRHNEFGRFDVMTNLTYIGSTDGPAVRFVKNFALHDIDFPNLRKISSPAPFIEFWLDYFPLSMRQNRKMFEKFLNLIATAGGPTEEVCSADYFDLHSMDKDFQFSYHWEYVFAGWFLVVALVMLTDVFWYPTMQQQYIRVVQQLMKKRKIEQVELWLARPQQEIEWMREHREVVDKEKRTMKWMRDVVGLEEHPHFIKHLLASQLAAKKCAEELLRKKIALDNYKKQQAAAEINLKLAEEQERMTTRFKTIYDMKKKLNVPLNEDDIVYEKTVFNNRVERWLKQQLNGRELTNEEIKALEKKAEGKREKFSAREEVLWKMRTVTAIKDEKEKKLAAQIEMERKKAVEEMRQRYREKGEAERTGRKWEEKTRQPVTEVASREEKKKKKTSVGRKEETSKQPEVSKIDGGKKKTSGKKEEQTKKTSDRPETLKNDGERKKTSKRPRASNNDGEKTSKEPSGKGSRKETSRKPETSKNGVEKKKTSGKKEETSKKPEISKIDDGKKKKTSKRPEASKNGDEKTSKQPETLKNEGENKKKGEKTSKTVTSGRTEVPSKNTPKTAGDVKTKKTSVRKTAGKTPLDEERQAKKKVKKTVTFADLF